jgi:hypothetical protein
MKAEVQRRALHKFQKQMCHEHYADLLAVYLEARLSGKEGVVGELNIQIC